MMGESIRILVVEDNPGDARLLRQLLLEGAIPVDFVHVERLDEALKRLSQEQFDVVLADLSLPDGQDLEVLGRLRARAPGVPVLVLTGNDEHVLGLQAMLSGAQGALVKSHLDSELLSRVILYAIERQQLGVELEQARLQIQRQNQFLSHFSHELRTPLTAAYQFVTILLDGLAGEINAEQREYLGIILRNVNQLRNMIRDLLDVKRVRTGKLTLQPRCLSLIGIAEEMVRALQTTADTRKICLAVADFGFLPPVDADPARVQQVLANLLDNALKFSSEGGTITLNASLYANDPQFLCISIADTGCGISPEGQQHIFEYLYQEESGIKTSRSGLGIGLYICREIVQRHGGQIWVESEAGKGSVFYFTLPRFPFTGLIAPLLQAPEQAAGTLLLLTVELCNRATPGGRLSESLRQRAWDCLERGVRPEMEVLLPRMVSLLDREIFFLVVNAAEPISVHKIWKQLGCYADMKENEVEVQISYYRLERSRRPNEPLPEREIEDLAADIEREISRESRRLAHRRKTTQNKENEAES